MSDEGYFYAKIYSYEREIEECNAQIRKINQQINELTRLKEKIFNYSQMFDEVQIKCRSVFSFAVEELFSRKRYSQKIVKSYEQGMGELLLGSECQKVADEGVEAEESVKQKLRSMEEQREDLCWQIANYKSGMSECRAELRKIEEREREYGRYNY